MIAGWRVYDFIFLIGAAVALSLATESNNAGFLAKDRFVFLYQVDQV